MSFLAPAQRGYESIAHSDLAHLPRVQMNSLPSFDNLASPPSHQVYHSNVNHHPSNASPSSDRSLTISPKVGQTRCYWSLLSPDLEFLYLDPVLASHLGEQADLLLGKSLLEFVHPDEQASAEKDLGGVLESRTLHGSVTRARYSRLSRVRRQLGYQGPIDDWPEADKIAVDANYMSVDIVLNWAADGLALCFMHAVVDLTARDNDENNKTGWTNWCGTPYMSLEQVQLMYQQLVNRVPQPSSITCVFQVLLNSPERQLWVSWPPDPQGRGPTSKDFARLAAEVKIGNSVVTGTDARTSCTRRYKARQSMHFGSNTTLQVESIFIPYGSIIFACHRVDMHPTPGKDDTSENIPNSHHYQQANSYDQSPHHSYSHPPPPPPNYGISNLTHPSSQYPLQHWSPTSDPGSQQSYPWTSQGTPLSTSPVSNVRSSAYHPSHQQTNQWASHPPYNLETNNTPFSYSAPTGMAYSGPASCPVGAGPPSPVNDAVPPSRIPRRGGTNRDTYGNGGRSSGNPPVGVNKCASCKVTHSPEWRKGPSGKKDLCNACGLRFARSKAKKEGNPQRRRKERIANTMSVRSGDSPISPLPIPFPLSGRSTYDHGSFSTGSPSGSEVYSHTTAYDGSPSPPPLPPVGPNFTSYTNVQHAHSPQASSHLVSPLSYYLPQPSSGTATHHSIHGSGHPRLDTIPPLQSPPIVSPNTPPASSPLNPRFTTSTFKREDQCERDQDRLVLHSNSPETRNPSHKWLQ